MTKEAAKPESERRNYKDLGDISVLEKAIAEKNWDIFSEEASKLG
jgi:hypothetical protein